MDRIDIWNKLKNSGLSKKIRLKLFDDYISDLDNGFITFLEILAEVNSL
jgi:hypothetical protein